jgi:hypothetical protein
MRRCGAFQLLVCAILLLLANASHAHSQGSAILFASGAGDLTKAQQEEIFGSLGLKVAADGKSLVDTVCEQPADARSEFVDLNKDGSQELFVTYGNTCLFGGTGSAVVLFVKGADGKHVANLGFPAAAYTVLETGNQGFPDLQMGGMGFCDGVWRWNGKAYEHYRDQPTDEGGCDEVEHPTSQ